MEKMEMEALKKAYAAVILNMAKEAAARVKLSEQKALKFQQDIETTKEEALRMLLRLKLMIDTKTTEAGKLSQNQQRRIEELEAQLNEAEEVIIDLRAELSNVQEELIEVKNKHLHHLRPHEKEDLVCCNSNISKSKLTNSESFKIPTAMGSTACSSTDMSDPALCNYSKENHNMASEIAESNDPETYQNGWCEIEISLADERLHSRDDPTFPVTIKQVAEPTGRDVGAYIMPLSKVKKIENEVREKPLRSNVSKQRSYTFHGKNQRKTCYSKTKNGSCKVRRNKFIMSQRPPTAVSRSARYVRTGACYDIPGTPSTNIEKKYVAGNRLMSGNLVPHNKDLAIAVARRSLRKRRVKYLGDCFPASLSHCSLSNQSERTGRQSSSLSHSKSKAVECTVKSTKVVGEGNIEKGTSLLAASSVITTDNKICRKYACANIDAHEDSELIDVSVMVEDGDDDALHNLEILPVDTITSEESEKPTLLGNNTPIKYTFSRKRKKDTLSNPNENYSSESLLKKRSAEIENIDPRLQDSRLAKDSPLKSKQLVQIARQLISLSGRG